MLGFCNVSFLTGKKHQKRPILVNNSCFFKLIFINKIPYNTNYFGSIICKQELLWKMVSNSGDTLTSAHQEQCTTPSQHLQIYLQQVMITWATVICSHTQSLRGLLNLFISHREGQHFAIRRQCTNCLMICYQKMSLHHPRALGLHQWC